MGHRGQFATQTHPAISTPRSRPRSSCTRTRSPPQRVPRFITGKFCEHLYFNVTNGMDAQILKNPTFSDYPFATGQMSPDGVATFHYSPDEIARAIRGDAGRWGWPASDIDGLVKSRNEAVACWWAKLGDVQASPDTGPYGGRAQRIAARASGQGTDAVDLAASASGPKVRRAALGPCAGPGYADRGLLRA